MTMPELDQRSSRTALESNVRYYSRLFPRSFAQGRGSVLVDEHGDEWLDFLSGAGALNYGHNHPVLKAALLQYIESDGVVTSLDMSTTAKQDFLVALEEVILEPRQLSYVCQFCGPTGTTTVEAALRLARKATGRHGVVSFSNSFHGMSNGARSASASFRRRDEESLSPDWVTFLPFDGFTDVEDEVRLIRSMLTKAGSGVAAPAAFIVELVQGEGGVNVASQTWVQEIAQLARELGSLLIVDEIQNGCGRTGRFFTFEHYGIVPDLVCLSKSISAMGMPMGILLIAPGLDVWRPGEHSGTFRGFNYGFVTAAAALRHLWADPRFQEMVTRRGDQLGALLAKLRLEFPDRVQAVRHLGMIGGLQMVDAEQATAVQQHCFAHGLVVETCGPDSATIKLLPPINVEAADLERGGVILRAAIEALAP